LALVVQVLLRGIEEHLVLIQFGTLIPLLLAALVLVVSFMHYYYEGFVWRGDSPLRRHVRFSKR